MENCRTVNLAAGLPLKPEDIRSAPIGQPNPRAEQANHSTKLPRNLEGISQFLLYNLQSRYHVTTLPRSPKGIRPVAIGQVCPRAIAGVPTIYTNVSINMHINHNNYNNHPYKSKYIQENKQRSYHRYKYKSTDINTNPQTR